MCYKCLELTMASQAECDVIDTFEDVCDINDVFDSISLSEVHFSKKGYEEGFKKGEVTGKSEGFHLGYHRGAEIGAEIGYYTGVVESLLAISQSSDTQLSAKLVDSINKLSELLKQFPNTNSEDIDIIALRDNIKARYKKEVVMQNMHVEVLRSRLDEIVRFVKPLLPLANCHMVNFFTDHLWEAFIPSDIRAEVETMDVSDVCNVFWKRTDDGECPSLQMYLDTAADHTVCGVALSHEELLLKLERRGHEPPCRLHIKQFMSPKKGHEVEQMSQAVATVAAAARVSHIVDVGSGKGYLSSMLALQHGLRVLGVDSSQTNTHGAASRVHKLQKYWPGLCRQAEEMQQGLTPPSFRGKSSKKDTSPPLEEEGPQQHAVQLLKQVTAHVGPDTDLLGLVERELGPSEGLGLVGLHTCGDLGPTCLRLLAGHTSVRALCNVGCCYHLLTEQFDTQDPYWGIALEPGDGFPVSAHLTQAGFSLGRNARMLAAQSVDRIAHNREVGSESLFYRALLQELLVAKCGDDMPQGQVGRLAAKCSSFDDYVHKAITKLGLSIQVSCDEVAALYKSFLPLRDSIKVFFLLRVYLAPVVEAVILLDRLLFLHEQGLEEAFLVELFDPVVSPRCYALVALRPTDSS